MLKITKKIEYALMALKHMGEKPPGAVTSVRELCSAYNAPFDTMAKVLQTLASHQAVKATHGVKGGYELVTPLDSITFKDLETMIEGGHSAVACLSGANNCSMTNQCNIITPIQKLELKLNRYLDNLTLNELLLGQLREISS